MVAAYTVKPSSGKGRGVFATKPIPSGTTIMKDPVAIRIKKDMCSIGEADVTKAFHKLNKTDQTRFLALHEGSRPYKSRIFRIYKANVFGGDEGSCLYLSVSLINHSCVPNAEVATHEDDSMEVVAVKPIAKGEEVSIAYIPYFAALAKKHRQIVTRVYYGFVCRCQACSLPPEQQILSDSRRQLLNALTFNLEGNQPIDTMYFDILGRLSPKGAEDDRVRRGLPVQRLNTPLTTHQKTAYSFLVARLLEAEGLSGMRLASAYTSAAYGVLHQIDDIDRQYNGVAIFAMAELVVTWMQKGMEVVKEVRGSRSDAYRAAEAEWKGLKDHDLVLACRVQAGAGKGDSYAIRFRVVNRIAYSNLLSKEECNKILRGK